MRYGAFFQSSNKGFLGFDKSIYYSCDMIRFKFKFMTVECKNEFISWLNHVAVYGWSERPFFDIDVKYNHRMVSFGYSNFFTITSRPVFGIKSVIKMGICFIGLDDSCKENSLHGFIEFNPNKLDYVFFNKLYHMILTRSRMSSVSGIKFEVTRWDLAIDIPVKREALSLLKDNRDYIYYDTQLGVTQSLGQHGKPGYVKLYDKTRESKLQETVTRLELTLDDLEVHKFPEVVLEQSQAQLPLGLNDTHAVLVELLNNLPYQERLSYLKRVGRKVREKIEPYVIGQNKLEYDYECIAKIFAMLHDLEKGIFPEFDYLPFSDT